MKSSTKRVQKATAVYCHRNMGFVARSMATRHAAMKTSKHIMSLVRSLKTLFVQYHFFRNVTSLSQLRKVREYQRDRSQNAKDGTTQISMNF